MLAQDGRQVSRSGSDFERKVARLTRGRRRPQSRDDTPVGGVLESEWRIESKFGQQVSRQLFMLLDPTPGKTCPRCGEVKPAEGFYLKVKTGKLSSWCRKCTIAQQRVRYLKLKAEGKLPRPTSEQYKKSDLRRKFGLEWDQYQGMVEAQAGLCAVCCEPPPPGGLGSNAVLQVDHDHTSGQVRWLLCGPCNRAVAAVRENPKVAEAVAMYLRAWGSDLSGEWALHRRVAATPKFFWDAYGQAERNGAVGDLRKSAVVVSDEGEPVLFIAKLQDVVTWRDALVGIASGHQIKTLVRQIKRALDSIDDVLKGEQ